VQDRLHAAYMRFHPVRATDLPEGELRRLFVGIKDDLTFEEPSAREGRLAAPLQGLSDEDASAVAARIWRLYCDLRDWLKQDERGRPAQEKPRRCLGPPAPSFRP
jgi:hypothetical protein